MRYTVDFPGYIFEEAQSVLEDRLSNEKIGEVFRLVLESVRAHVVRSTMEILDRDPTGALSNSWAVHKIGRAHV